MEKEIDIEQLLSDETEEETTDLKTEEKPAEQKSDAEGADKDKEAEQVKVLKRELRKRQEEIKALKATKETPKEEKEEVKEPIIDEKDPGAQLWIKKIDEMAESKIKPILDANLKRAVKSFIEKHPEYATGDYKSKLKECVDFAKGKVEEGEILESMSRMWGAQNYQELERAETKRAQGRTNAQKSALKSSFVGEGVKNEDDFTEEEHEKAAKLGMTAEEYRKALASYRANRVSTN